MQIIWTYRAPFDALITYMTVFAQPDTETCGISDTQHFRTYQFSCLLMYNTYHCIMFKIQLKKVSQESKCQTWRLVKWAMWELISKNKLFNVLNLIIKMKSAVSGIRPQVSSLTVQGEQICLCGMKGGFGEFNFLSQYGRRMQTSSQQPVPGCYSIKNVGSWWINSMWQRVLPSIRYLSALHTQWFAYTLAIHSYDLPSSYQVAQTDAARACDI